MAKEEAVRVSGARCLKCSAFVYSRAQHDFRSCPCGAVQVDGGQGSGYGRVLGQPEDWKWGTAEVDTTLAVLYDDWNHSLDKLGIIKAP